MLTDDCLTYLTPLINLKKLNISHCGLNQLLCNSTTPDGQSPLANLIDLDLSFNELNDEPLWESLLCLSKYVMVVMVMMTTG